MNIFQQSPVARLKRNKFDLSHEKKLTFDMGKLYPVLVLEAVPGDKFRIRSQALVRFLALLAPIMHRVDLTIHYFKVPYRLLWDSWEDHITGGRDGTAAPTFPQFDCSTLNAQMGAAALRPGSLLDYLGFPVMNTAEAFNAAYNTSAKFSVLPVRAYNLIYDQYYRDQNVEASQLPANFKASGLIAAGDYGNLFPVRIRSWEKDYLTSALPWTQRGAEASLPISSTITAVSGQQGKMRKTSDGSVVDGGNVITDGLGGVKAGSGVGANAYYDPNGSLIASSSSLTVNALRASIKLQQWLENNARSGGRYIEQLLAHFGVVSSDARLQRAEYLGGTKIPVVVSEVVQTSGTVGGTPQGTMAGHALSVGAGNGVITYCEEHCLIMGIMSVLPRTAYQRSLSYPFYRQLRSDFYFPEFAHLGEQAVYNMHAYLNLSDAPAAAGMGSVFGYQSRYAEYKYEPSTVHGQFRDSLAFWHLGRQFTAQPNLNTAFIMATPRTDIFATPSDPNHLVGQIYHQVDALRLMPRFGVPKF